MFDQDEIKRKKEKRAGKVLVLKILTLSEQFKCFLYLNVIWIITGDQLHKYYIILFKVFTIVFTVVFKLQYDLTQLSVDDRPEKEKHYLPPKFFHERHQRKKNAALKFGHQCK